MKTIQLIAITALVLGFGAGMANAGDKYYVPSWGMPQGQTTTFEKGHKATTEYNEKQIVSYDKQHKPWFQSTLKPSNLK